LPHGRNAADLHGRRDSLLAQALDQPLLDKLANERPDWYVYWPIRRHLLTHELDETALRGFFSPMFSFKTGLDHGAAQRFAPARPSAPTPCCSRRGPTWARPSSMSSSRASPSITA
jgi:hypothetical protein